MTRAMKLKLVGASPAKIRYHTDPVYRAKRLAAMAAWRAAKGSSKAAVKRRNKQQKAYLKRIAAELSIREYLRAA